MQMKKKFNPQIKNGLFIIIGLLCGSAAYKLYLIPNNIVAGGFTGIGQLINHFTHLSVGMINLLLNIPLFLLSMKSLGLKFGMRSLIAMAGLSLLIDHLPLPPATDDLLLASVYGGVLGGFGFGLILRGNATTGGTDMLASLLHRYIPMLRVSYCIFVIDGLIIIASAFVFEPQAAMYGLICTFITNVLIDLVLEGPNSAHSYFIVSDKSDDIAKIILQEMNRGVTALEGMGMYNGVRKHVLLCVVNRFETIQLRKIIFSVDPSAFVVANKAHEVLGEGFKEQIK